MDNQVISSVWKYESKYDLHIDKFLELLLKYGYVWCEQDERDFRINLSNDEKRLLADDFREFQKGLTSFDIVIQVKNIRKLYKKKLLELKQAGKSEKDTILPWFSKAHSLFFDKTYKENKILNYENIPVSLDDQPVKTSYVTTPNFQEKSTKPTTLPPKQVAPSSKSDIVTLTPKRTAISTTTTFSFLHNVSTSIMADSRLYAVRQPAPAKDLSNAKPVLKSTNSLDVKSSLGATAKASITSSLEITSITAKPRHTFSPLTSMSPSSRIPMRRSTKSTYGAPTQSTESSTFEDHVLPTKSSGIRGPVSHSTISTVGTPIRSNTTSNVGTPIRSITTSIVGAPMRSTTTSTIGAPMRSTTTSTVGAPMRSTTTSTVGAPMRSTTTSTVGTPIRSTTTSTVGAPMRSTTTSTVGAPMRSTTTSTVGAPMRSTTISSVGIPIRSTTTYTVIAPMRSTTTSNVGAPQRSTTTSTVGAPVRSTTFTFRASVRSTNAFPVDQRLSSPVVKSSTDRTDPSPATTSSRIQFFHSKTAPSRVEVSPPQITKSSKILILRPATTMIARSKGPIFMNAQSSPVKSLLRPHTPATSYNRKVPASFSKTRVKPSQIALKYNADVSKLAYPSSISSVSTPACPSSSSGNSMTTHMPCSSDVSSTFYYPYSSDISTKSRTSSSSGISTPDYPSSPDYMSVSQSFSSGLSTPAYPSSPDYMSVSQSFSSGISMPSYPSFSSGISISDHPSSLDFKSSVVQSSNSGTSTPAYQSSSPGFHASNAPSSTSYSYTSAVALSSTSDFTSSASSYSTDVLTVASPSSGKDILTSDTLYYKDGLMSYSSPPYNLVVPISTVATSSTAEVSFSKISSPKADVFTSNASFSSAGLPLSPTTPVYRSKVASPAVLSSGNWLPLSKTVSCPNTSASLCSTRATSPTTSLPDPKISPLKYPFSPRKTHYS